MSEAYALHRQTFYLAQDYFDRFMMTQNNIEKGMLQLIGITCLFIASKMEVTTPLNILSRPSHISRISPLQNTQQPVEKPFYINKLFEVLSSYFLSL